MCRATSEASLPPYYVKLSDFKEAFSLTATTASERLLLVQSEVSNPVESGNY